ncbi:unnamed protein product [Urochloa humidicola]
MQQLRGELAAAAAPAANPQQLWCCSWSGRAWRTTAAGRCPCSARSTATATGDAEANAVRPRCSSPLTPKLVRPARTIGSTTDFRVPHISLNGSLDSSRVAPRCTYAHLYGSSYLLHDRLHSCSDYHIADVCSLCGSLLTATVIKSDAQKKAKREMLGLPTVRPQKNLACQACKTSKGMETVAMPYVFRYLASELAAMNIKLELRLSNKSELPSSQGS